MDGQDALQTSFGRALLDESDGNSLGRASLGGSEPSSVDRQKTVGNSLGRLGKAPLGGSEHAAWMDRKPWKYIAWGELRWEGARLQRGRGGIEHAAWTDRKPLEVAWGTPRWEGASAVWSSVGRERLKNVELLARVFSRQIPSMRKIFQMVFKRWVIGHA